MYLESVCKKRKKNKQYEYTVIIGIQFVIEKYSMLILKNKKKQTTTNNGRNSGTIQRLVRGGDQRVQSFLDGIIPMVNFTSWQKSWKGCVTWKWKWYNLLFVPLLKKAGKQSRPSAQLKSTWIFRRIPENLWRPVTETKRRSHLLTLMRKICKD